MNTKRIAVGVTVGALLAATAFIAGRARSGAFATGECPRGWSAQAPSSGTGASARLVCTSNAEGLEGARIELLWAPGGTISDEALVAAARGAGWSSEGLRVDRSPQAGLEGGALAREHPGAAMKSDVYFLSAGQRYGLLSIVYGPSSTFVREDTVAAWMETVRGTAPWGAPVTPELSATCPEGFTALRATSPSLVIRCMRNVGTPAFTVLQLTQSNGGFGSEQDRARLAGDIAQRVASSGGGRARVLVEPTPFTRARNVDAMRASFETEERVTLNSKIAWMRTAQSGNLVALYAGPDTDELANAARGLLTNVRGARVTNGMLAGISVVMVLAGAIAGALSGRKREGG